MKEASIEELKEILPEEVSIHFKEILNSMK